jgi:hypothetical protein
VIVLNNPHALAIAASNLLLASVKFCGTDNPFMCM